MNLSGRFLSARLHHVLKRRLRIVAGGFALHDFQGPGRADVQTGAQAVAIDLLDQHRLVFVVDPERTLHAGRRAQAAAVARRPVDFDDFAFGHIILLGGCPSPGNAAGTGMRPRSGASDKSLRDSGRAVLDVGQQRSGRRLFAEPRPVLDQDIGAFHLD